jgi:hypothetical protein
MGSGWRRPAASGGAKRGDGTRVRDQRILLPRVIMGRVPVEVHVVGCQDGLWPSAREPNEPSLFSGRGILKASIS